MISIKKFGRIGYGKKKIFYSWPIEDTEKLKKTLEKRDISIIYITKEYFYNIVEKIPKIWTINGDKTPPNILKKAEKFEWYKTFAKTIIEVISKEKIKYAVLQYYLLTDRYLQVLKKMNVILIAPFADDPEDSYVITKKYALKYDKIICSGVQFNEKITIKDKIKSFGAKKVEFIPILPDPKHYDYEKIDYAKKDIDLVYIGALQWRKWYRIHILYKNFPLNLVLYGRYDPRKNRGLTGLIYKIFDIIFPVPPVKMIKDSKVKDIYKRTKIGFNCHQKWGPSNSRTYELCLNGAIQITDNPKGHKELFDVGKEVICYKNMNEAIELIRYYLKHNSVRTTIAESGYNKAMREYTYEAIFDKQIKFIME